MSLAAYDRQIFRSQLPMIDLIQKAFFKYFEAGNWTQAFILLAIFTIGTALRKSASILDILERLRARKHADLLQFLKQEHLSEEVRARAAEELNRRIYGELTMIRKDEHFRRRIEAILAWSRGEIELRKLARAQALLEMNDGHVVVKISNFDRFEFAWTIVSCVVAIAISVGIFSLLILGNPSLLQGVALALMTLVASLGAILISTGLQPVLYVRQLKPILEKTQALMPTPPVPGNSPGDTAPARSVLAISSSATEAHEEAVAVK